MPAIGVSYAGKLSLFLLAVVAASAQIYPPTGYPGGGYPPGGYPNGYPGRYPGGVGMPIPTRGKTQPGTTTKGQPLPSFQGKLKQLDSKTISLSLDDDRVLDFRRDSKTKFFKDDKEIKDPKFAVGDQLNIEGPEDNGGYLTAVNVYWLKAAGKTETTDAKTDTIPDTWSDTPAQPARATEVAPPPAKRDADDPGPPKLQRGKVADATREVSTPVPDQPPAAVAGSASGRAAAGTAPVTAPSRPTLAAADGKPPERLPQYVPSDDKANEAIPNELRHQDDLIRKAADTALDFTESLPNYICQELMSRYRSETRPADWHAIDVLGMEVVYEKGKEDYRKLTINGKPTTKKLEETGDWSTGEFGTILINLFSPATDTEFHYSKDERMGGVMTKKYDYSVAHARSAWHVGVGGQNFVPGYRGSIWIDPHTARVMRIEMSTREFPDSFPLDDLETAVDYENVRLGDLKQYLLPVHAETLSCERGSNSCSRNAIDFRLYKKYGGESTITFGDPKQ